MSYLQNREGYFQEQFGVSIESARHKGTSVSLKLPIEIQGRDDKC